MKPVNSILDIFMAKQNLPADKIDHLKGLIHVKSVVKGTILQRKGDKYHNGFFVKKGLLRSFTIDEKGKEHIFMFAPEGWIVSDIESLTKEEPATLFIDVLEDSEIEVINKDLLEKLQVMPEVFIQNDAERLVNRIGVLQRRVLMLMSATARERYESFLKTYPDIMQRVPLRMIASYLGITPEALSKIRSEMARAK